MLARSHRDFLTRDGYAVLSGLVPDRLLKAARDVICSFVGADLDRPETWYRHEPLVWSVVPVHHAQAFWDVRQWPALHDAFAKIWGTEKLWVTMDRGIFKGRSLRAILITSTRACCIGISTCGPRARPPIRGCSS